MTGTVMKRTFDRAVELQGEIEGMARRVGKGKYGRVLKMARRPTHDEFIRTSQITGLGVIIIGSIGFIIYLLWTEIPELLGL
ncbi:MAG: protein translocase SEC61 complex subunit gamma [Thermoplasmata archaeon]|nr:protein translocase SEC61 complex subunit gamma [Thermoplasmata archaeon]